MPKPVYCELHAVREARDPVLLGACHLPHEDAARTWADEVVALCEDEGSWPEGFDAELTMDGQRLFLDGDDGWEPVDP